MIMISAAVGMILLSAQDMRWIADQFGLGVSTIFVVLWTWLRFPVAILLLMAVVGFVYYVLPNADEPFRFVTLGAVLAVIVWVAGTLGFSYFVSNFVIYNATYGSLGTFMALQLYFFISASILLLGAEVNAEIYYRFDEDEEEGEKTKEASQSEE
jgi:membrane protein